MQKAKGNHCIKKISQVSVVHENCCKPILTIEKQRERERELKATFRREESVSETSSLIKIRMVYNV
jgi:hypothetical protein